MDYQHLIEMLVSAVFTAGMVWGTVRAELRSLREADKRTDKRLDGVCIDVTRAHSRIDHYLQKR